MENKTIRGTEATVSTVFFVIMLMTINLLLPANVTGSMPVEKTLTGCVIKGQFFSVTIDSRTNRPVKAYQIRMGQDLDLAAYEGKTVSMTGDLLPGDRFILKRGVRPVVIKGACDNDSISVIRKEFVMEYRVSAYQAAKKMNFAEALILANRALDLDKTLCGTYIDRAHIHYLKGDFASGAADIKWVREGRCADRQDLNFLLLEEIGITLEKAGRKTDAIEIYSMGLDSCRSDMCKETMDRGMKRAMVK
ncbi:MAG: hypothetical protein A4E69_02265 [Syntrophus sp. PtaB.Bin138]|nr:MAG: hypothetical protein A4E69_02265 [Syntrophus sp. PtaB.Bin138]